LSLLPKATEIADKTYVFDNSSKASKLKAILSQGQLIEQAGTKIDWVEKTIATLNERQQERLAVEQLNSVSLLASLERGEHIGKIKSVGRHFVVQQTKQGQAIIHENSILGLDKSAVGHNVLISYRDGEYRIAIPELSTISTALITIES
jgi:hypothetical protein